MTSKIEEPEPGERYRHFKGEERIYEIITVARDCDNPEKKLVIYRNLYLTGNLQFGTIWARSLEDFCGEKIFDKDEEHGGKKYKKGDKVKRFTFIE